MVDTPGSLPAGWTTEIKTHKNGPRAGTQYKCYIDPLTGKKFYSKKGVLRFLESRKCDDRKSEPEEKAVNTPCPEKIRSSPDSLPPGWIKEIKVRKNEQGVVYRKDPPLQVNLSRDASLNPIDPSELKSVYISDFLGLLRSYIDPATGYVFRSKVEVFRYLKTGVLGKRARKLDQRNVSGVQSLDDAITQSDAFSMVAYQLLMDQRQMGPADHVRYHMVKSQTSLQFDFQVQNARVIVLEQKPRGQLASKERMEHHDLCACSTGCLPRRQSERIQAAQLLKKQLLELEDGNQPSDLLEQQLMKKQLPEFNGNQPSDLLEQQPLKKQSLEVEDGDRPSDLLEQQPLKKQSLEVEDGDRPSDLLEQQLLRKQSPELEDGSQPLKGQLLKKQPPELQGRNQPSDLLQDQTHSAPLENQHYHEPGLPLKLKDKKPLEDVVAMESDNRKLEANGWLSRSDDELSEDVGPSEGKKQRRNQLPFESVHRNPSKNGSSSKSQDKLLGHNQLFESVGEKVSDMNQILKGLFHDSEEENQLDTMKKEANLVDQSLNTKSESPLVDQSLNAKSENLLVDQSLNAKSSPLESEDNKQLHDEMAKPKAKSTNIHFRKRKAEKASVLPRRASKRLAGLEADTILNFENPDHACRQAAKRQALSVHPASLVTEECEQGMANDGKPVMVEMKRAAIIEQDGSATPSSIATEERQPGKANEEEPVVVEVEKAGTIETEKPSADKAEKSTDNDERPQSLVSPFGDSWPDPCLEFAFKTLTGEISMDTLVIGDYFQPQLGGNQFSKPSL
ncbi:hypothetical protein ACLOJK_024524 [Asimina triloba]